MGTRRPGAAPLNRHNRAIGSDGMSTHVHDAPPAAAPRRRTRGGTGASGPVRRMLGAHLVAELETLCDRPSIGWVDVCQDVAAVAAAAVIGVLLGHVVGPVLAVCYIGVRQRHLSNLGHECVHAKLVPSPLGNRLIGHMLTAVLGEAFLPYRSSHAVHHALLGKDADPMFQSYRDRDIRSARPNRRSFVLRVIVRHGWWTLPKSAVLALVAKAPDETWRAMAGRSALGIGLLAASWRLGVLTPFLIYWLTPLIFIRPLVTWITDLGNHAGVIENGDPLLQTRGWSSHWLTRHLLGGHLDDMYHPVHHLCPRIPWRQLPDAAALIRASLDRFGEVPWCSGFFFRRRSTPGQPCVLEDIIARLGEQSVPEVRHRA